MRVELDNLTIEHTDGKISIKQYGCDIRFCLHEVRDVRDAIMLITHHAEG